MLDALLLYSDKQAIASAASTNVIAHGHGKVGSGEPLVVVVVVTTALDAGTGDETYTVKIQTDSTDAFGSATDVTGALSLPRGSEAGTVFFIPVPPAPAMEEFSRLLYAVGGTTPAGNVTAFLTKLSMIQDAQLYPDAITISG